MSGIGKGITQGGTKVLIADQRPNAAVEVSPDLIASDQYNQYPTIAQGLARADVLLLGGAGKVNVLLAPAVYSEDNLVVNGNVALVGDGSLIDGVASPTPGTPIITLKGNGQLVSVEVQPQAANPTAPIIFVDDYDGAWIRRCIIGELGFKGAALTWDSGIRIADNDIATSSSLIIKDSVIVHATEQVAGFTKAAIHTEGDTGGLGAPVWSINNLIWVVTLGSAVQCSAPGSIKYVFNSISSYYQSGSISGVNFDVGDNVVVNLFNDVVDLTDVTISAINGRLNVSGSVGHQAGTPVSRKPDAIGFGTGLDEDINLLRVNVTGTPLIKWNELADLFDFSNGISAPTLANSGRRLGNVNTVTGSSHAVVDSDHFIHMAASGARTVNLPSASVNQGRILIVTDASGKSGVSGFEVTIVADGTDKINGRSSVQIVQAYGSLTIYCDGAHWFNLTERLGQSIIFYQDCFDMTSQSLYADIYDITSLTGGAGSNVVTSDVSHATLTTQASAGFMAGTKTTNPVAERSRKPRLEIQVKLSQVDADTEFYMGFNVQSDGGHDPNDKFVIIGFDKNSSDYWTLYVDDGAGTQIQNGTFAADTNNTILTLWIDSDGSPHWAVNGLEQSLALITKKMTVDAHYIEFYVKSATGGGGGSKIAKVDYIEWEKSKGY